MRLSNPHEALIFQGAFVLQGPGYDITGAVDVVDADTATTVERVIAGFEPAAN